MINLAKKTSRSSRWRRGANKNTAHNTQEHGANVPGAVGSVCTTGDKQLGSPFVRLVLHELSGHVVAAP
jgi:hypothetical protein